MMSFQPAKNKRIKVRYDQDILINHFYSIHMILLEKGTSISIPIIYGSKAIPLKLAATEAEDGDDVDTHSWTVYMRPVDGRDLTWLISKVEFHLHESFKTPRRSKLYRQIVFDTFFFIKHLPRATVRTEAPYEESEKGWVCFLDNNSNNWPSY